MYLASPYITQSVPSETANLINFIFDYMYLQCIYDCGSVADPDLGSGTFLTPRPPIRDG
jgi:hypothetical protein